MAVEYNISPEGVLIGVELNGQTSVTIPSNSGIVEIGAFAFNENTPVETLVLNNQCKIIRNKAFFFCKTLKSLTIGTGLEIIEEFSFAGCNNLENISLDGWNSHYSVYDGMLYSSDKTKLVLGVNASTIGAGSTVKKFSSNITSIGRRAFSFCNGITYVDIPSTVTKLEDYAFSDCNGLTSISIPANVTAVGYGAFCGCDNINEVSIAGEKDGAGHTVSQTLDGLGFANMQNLLVVKMTDSVESICSVLGEETFTDGGLRLRLDGDIESMSADVREHWYGTYGVLPEKVTIKFYANPNLEPIYEAEVTPGTKFETEIEIVDETASGVYHINGWYYDTEFSDVVDENAIVKNYRRGDNGEIIDVTEISLYADYNTIIDFSEIYETDLTDGKVSLIAVKDWDKLWMSHCEIPSSFTYEDTEYVVTTIGANLFAGGELASTITIPKTIKSIGKSAFKGCTGMTSVVFESGSKCTTINALAFAETGITSLVIPDSVVKIKQGAFYGCGSLSNVTVGANVSEIGIDSGNNHGTFEDCYSLDVVKVGSLNQWLGISFGSSSCNPISNGGGLYIGNSEQPLAEITSDNLGNYNVINDFAFVGCGHLSTVDLTGTHIQKIGDEAFSSCGDLDTVILDNNGMIMDLGRAAFSNCKQITSIIVPSSISEIGGFAFNACSNLETVTIDNGITKISNSMFSYCQKLEEISLPSSVNTIGDSAFSGDIALTKAEFEGRCKFGDYSFYNCSSLAEIDFNYEQNGDFGNNVFEKCSNISKIHGIEVSLTMLPLFQDSKDSIVEIGITGVNPYLLGKFSSGIQQLTNLNNIIIPESIIDIYEGVFDEAIFVGDTEPPVLFNNIAKEIKPSGESGPSYYVVDDWIVARYGEVDSSVQSADLTFSNIGIEVRGIANNTRINAESSFVLPDTLCCFCDHSFYTTLDRDIWSEYPFVGKGLTVSIPNANIFSNGYFGWWDEFSSPLYYGANLVANGIDIIDEIIGTQGNLKKQTLILTDMSPACSFSGCTSITDLDLGERITDIQDWSFNYCSSLKRIIFRGSNIHFNYSPFSRCDSLGQNDSGIYAQSIEAWCGCTGSGNPLSIAHKLYIYNQSTGNYTLVENLSIPNGITSVGENAFAGATCLQTLTVPDSVVTISDSAFFGCTNLTSVTLGNGITEIGGSVFYGCTALSTINIPSSVTRIDSWAFYGVTGIFDTTTIPGVRIVDGWAYRSESGLTGNVNLSSISGIADYAFADIGISSVTIGGISSIPEGAFTRCRNLVSVILSEGTVTISNEAFSGCSSLSSITIPSSVTYLGDRSFENCTSLSSINIPHGITRIFEHTFDGVTGIFDTTTIPNVSLVDGWVYTSTGGLTGDVDLSSISGIADYAFAQGGISSVTIGGISSIPISAFGDCESLESVVLSEGTLTIMDAAFLGCNNLSSITIPSTVTYLGIGAFQTCSSLSDVIIGTSVEIISDYCFSVARIGELVIPNSVHTIGTEAFSANRELIRIDFGTNVQTIGSRILAMCEKLSEVVFHGGKPQNAVDDCLDGVPNNCAFYFESGASGWVDGETWCGRVFHVLPEGL